VEARFDAQPVSSDGGLVLIRSADERLQLMERAAALLEDGRDRSKIRHELGSLLRQRVYAICAGYEDCNDANDLRLDPVHELVVGAALASQPTLSRFENGVMWKALKGLNDLLFEIAWRDLKTAREIVLDIDATDDETHGKQQLSFFHGYYDQHMFHPLLVYANDRLVFALLRPGNVHAGRGAMSIVQRLIRKIRSRRRRVRIFVRGDAGFALPRFYDMLEKERVSYTLGLITNDRLRAYAQKALERSRRKYLRTGRVHQIFGAVNHRAESWTKRRRVVFKAEYLPDGGNCRFVVTNRTQIPATVYDRYRKRGNMENRLKDLKNALQADRTSCHRFVANAFRLLIHSLAYVLMDHLRQATPTEPLRRAQFDTLRLWFLKIGALVKRSVRRVVIHLPASYPWKREWAATARTLAVPLSA
jgi:hypothetical protein